MSSLLLGEIITHFCVINIIIPRLDVIIQLFAMRTICIIFEQMYIMFVNTSVNSIEDENN